MIILPEQWQDVWTCIEDEFQESTEKGLAVIFSLQEVETVCAVKMLQAGLKTRDIHFAAYPVANYTELRHRLDSLLNGSEELRTVILINCGASAYVKDMAPANAVNVRYVVVDSHRPIHPQYNNPDDTDTFLFLADDDPLDQEDIPVADQVDDMSEEEKQNLLDLAAAEEQEEEDELDAMDSPAKLARLDGQSAPSRRQWRDKLRALKERTRIVDNYMDMGSSYGKPTPLVLQPLAELLCGKLDNTLLWPCAVGLTDQWVHQRLSSQHYDAWYTALRGQVQANDTNAAHAANNTGELNAAKVPHGRAVIVADREYRLMLHRHWNLFDAFVFSSYVAPRLQTWRSAGLDSLRLIFAKMGIAVEQAQTRYDSMQSSARKAFKDKLPTALLESRLAFNELSCDGFTLHHNRKSTAASDVVHACTALLSEHALFEVQGDRDNAAAFWAAAEAVDAHTVSGWQQLERGIEMAKAMQQAIIRDGGLMVSDRRLVVNAVAHMQELLLHINPPTNAREFRHPLTLLRLAHFVRDATKVARSAAGKKQCNFPILVVGPEDGKECCLVIGLRASVLPDKPQYNVFGRTFKSVLDAPDVVTCWDQSREAFDNAVVYIKKTSMKNFCIDVRETLRKQAEQAAAAQKAAQHSSEMPQQQQQQQQHGEQQQQWPPDGAAAAAAAAAGGGGGGEASGSRGGRADSEGGHGSLAETGLEGGAQGYDEDMVAASEDEAEGEGEVGQQQEAGEDEGGGGDE